MSASFIEANYESFFEKLSVIEFTADIVGNEAKGRTSQWVLHENKGRQIFWKTNISYPLISTRTSAYQRWQIFIFGQFGALCFLVTTVLRFALLLYYRRYYIYGYFVISLSFLYIAGFANTNPGLYGWTIPVLRLMLI